MICQTQTHTWIPSGGQGEYVKLGKQWSVIFVRCTTCGHTGFRRFYSPVVYTCEQPE